MWDILLTFQVLYYRGKGGKGGTAVVVVPDEPREKMLPGSVCVSATSQAVCMAGATASGLELYDYIASLRFEQVTNQNKLLAGEKMSKKEGITLNSI